MKSITCICTPPHIHLCVFEFRDTTKWEVLGQKNFGLMQFSLRKLEIWYCSNFELLYCIRSKSTLIIEDFKPTFPISCLLQNVSFWYVATCIYICTSLNKFFFLIPEKKMTLIYLLKTFVTIKAFLALCVHIHLFCSKICKKEI